MNLQTAIRYSRRNLVIYLVLTLGLGLLAWIVLSLINDYLAFWVVMMPGVLAIREYRTLLQLRKKAKDNPQTLEETI